MQVTRILHDFYDSDPKRGLYGGGGLDARIGPQPTTWAIRTATEGPAWGTAFKARLQEFPRSMQVACHGTSLAVESNNVTLDPGPEGRLGAAGDPRDLQGSSGRSRQRAVPAGSRRRDPRGGRRAAGHEGAGRRADLVGAPARHLPHGQRPGALGGRQVPPQPRRPEPVHLRRQQPRHVRPRPADDDHPGAGVPRRRAHLARFAKRGEI